jgi:hypothetical protein
MGIVSAVVGQAANVRVILCSPEENAYIVNRPVRLCLFISAQPFTL